MAASRFNQYLTAMGQAFSGSLATRPDGSAVSMAAAVDWGIAEIERAHLRDQKTFLIGNGGSASICSHMALDFCKNANLRVMALNDPVALTALANDNGVSHVFAKQLEFYALPGDFLIAISSSGRSPNILNAVAAARALKINVMTLSGFDIDNSLRSLGDMNIYTPSHLYGLVETAHACFLHAMLDLAMGWGMEQPVKKAPRTAAN